MQLLRGTRDRGTSALHGRSLRMPRHPSVFGTGDLFRPAETASDQTRALSSLRHDPAELWAALPSFRLERERAEMQHLIVRHDHDPVGLLYDHLRTRLSRVMADNGWSRVAVVSPRRGCGTSLVAANLALAMARKPSGRVVLLDFDLRKPALAGLFGLQECLPLREALLGEEPLASRLRRFGMTLALCANTRAEPDAAELLQEASTGAQLQTLSADLAPTVMIFDLPPLLEVDDLLGFLPQLDGVLLVADGTRTTAGDILECERLLKGQTEIMGVVMNRAEDSPALGAGKKKRRRWGLF